MMPDPQSTATAEVLWGLGRARAPRLRTMREFAEEEIVIPDGPYEGRRFRCSRQPYTGLWFDAVSSGRWNRYAATGPTQSGKTLCGFVIPIMYHLFEVGETVVCGVPNLDMVADKWRENLLPAIEVSRYRHLLPRHGAASQGGTVRAVRFTNGATLRFMTGGGGDKSVAGFTSRVVVITETDGMDVASERSREADRVTQLEARVLADESRKQVYMECTCSIEQGRIWQEYQNGTTSRIILPCPHCKSWVTPGRENLVGWQAADSAPAAAEASMFVCPQCGKPWTEEQRVTANVAGRLVHRGQDFTPAEDPVGMPSETYTLGFRWSAINNLFTTAALLGSKEWMAAKAVDEDGAEKEMRQFIWALPHEPTKVRLLNLDPHKLMERVTNEPKGRVPKETTVLTCAIDVHRHLCYWILIAWRTGGSGQVVDYGVLEVASQQLGEERAILTALREFRDTMVEPGWPAAEGEARSPDEVWVDARYQGTVIYAFCRESAGRYRPVLGFGVGQQFTGAYRAPTAKNAMILLAGEHYHLKRMRTKRIDVVEMDADYWKSYLHERLVIPVTAGGALMFYRPSAGDDHWVLVKHLAAERQAEKFKPGIGSVIYWERINRNNHYLDGASMACAAAHFQGVRVAGEEQAAPVAVQRRPRRGVRMPSGEAFLVTGRG